MKKWIALTVVFALILASYCGMGWLTEHTLKKNLAILSRGNGGMITIKDYHRRWFHSTAHVQWIINIPEKSNMFTQTNKFYTLEIPLTVWHGPIIVAKGKPWFGLGLAFSDVTLPAEYDAQLNAQYEATSTKPIFKITAFVNYANKTSLELIMPHFKLMAKNHNDQFDWLGMQTDISLSGNKKQLTGNVILNGLSWVKNNIQGVLGAVNSHYNLHKGTDGFYIGKAHLTVPSFVLMVDKHKTLQIIDAVIDSNSDVTDSLFSSSLSVAIKQAHMYQRVYADNRLDIALSNLDSKALAIINQKISQAQQQADLDRQRMLLSILPDLPALLCKGARLTISHLELGFPEGRLQASLDVHLPNEPISNPFQLLQKISGESKLRLSAPILKNWLQRTIKQKMLDNPVVQTSQAAGPLMVTSSLVPEVDNKAKLKAEEKIQYLLSIGALVVDGGDYVLAFKLSDGKVFINGQVFSPAMFAI